MTKGYTRGTKVTVALGVLIDVARTADAGIRAIDAGEEGARDKLVLIAKRVTAEWLRLGGDIGARPYYLDEPQP